MTTKTVGVALAGAVALLAGPHIAYGAEASIHHIHITTGPPTEAVRWYVQQMGCTAIADRNDAVKCGTVELAFIEQQTAGSTQGTGVNHISFSFADLPAKMAALEKVGVRGIGIRFQRFDDNATFHDVPGLFKLGYIFDPWGTRIELVEDPDTLGFHHIHLMATDPDATLKWYQTAFGGTPASLKGRMNGVKFGPVWVLVSRQETGIPATTKARAIDHLAFVVKAMDGAATDLRRQRVAFLERAGRSTGGTDRRQTRARHRAGQRQGRSGGARFCRRENRASSCGGRRQTSASRTRRRAPPGASPTCRASIRATPRRVFRSSVRKISPMSRRSRPRKRRDGASAARWAASGDTTASGATRRWAT